MAKVNQRSGTQPLDASWLKREDEPLSSNQRRVEIAVTLLQNGWDVLVRQLGLFEIIPGGWRQKFLNRPLLGEEADQNRPPPLPVPKAMRRTLESLGPTFVKLGQVLSTRADLLPEEYILELKKLQEHVAPTPWHLMETVLLQEWNERQQDLKSQHSDFQARFATSVKDIFIDFDTQPLATGSLGQAYNARILHNGKEHSVIVKVQRPGLLPIVDADIRILKDIVTLVERTSWGKHYNFSEMVNEFAMVLRNELDFIQEASNTEAISENIRQFYKKGEVKTASIFWEYTSQRMMTMEFIAGEKIDLFFIQKADLALARLQQQKEDPNLHEGEMDRERKRLAYMITNTFLHQIFIDGFFHADPHPGNLMLQADYDAGHMQLVLLDFGMVGRLDPRSRNILIDFLLAIIKFDARRATDRILEFGKAPPDIDRNQFAQDLDHVLRSTLGRPLREVSVGKVLQDILHMTLNYRIQLPGIFITLIRVLITVEGICRQLDREYVLIKAAEPFVVQAIKNQFVQTLTLRDTARVSLELTQLLSSLPRQIDDFLVNINSGRLRTITEHRNLEGIEHSLRLLANRVAAGLLVCGLVIASAISLGFQKGPQILGMPLVSIGFFSLTILLGLWLLNGINQRD